MTSLAQGGKFKHGFFSGMFASMAGSGMEASGWSVFSTDAGQLVTAAVVGGTASGLGGGKFANGAVTGAYTMLFNHMAHKPEDPPADQGGGSYVAGEGNITPEQFQDAYSGMTESQIMTGNSSFLGYNYPNDMSNPNTRFVMLANGKEVDMIHFMVVGRAGHELGFANEFHQLIRGKASAFNPQDLYSNRLGVYFFRAYGAQLHQNPTQISNYIRQYLTNPAVLYPAPFQPQWPTGPKF